MYKLHEFPSSGNCYKVLLLLAQLGEQVERLTVDILSGESRRPEFLAKNPNGKTPVLELPDGTFLPESNAILWYLAESTDFVPPDRLDRARALQWMFFEQYSHEPFIATARYWMAIRREPDHAEARLEERRTKGHAALKVMEGHLAQRSYFVAERYTIADIALFAYTHVATEGGFELEHYPAIRRWLDRVQSQPGHVRLAS